MEYSDEEFQEMRKARVRSEKEEFLREDSPVPDMAYLVAQIREVDAIEDKIAAFEKGINQARIEIEELHNKGKKICDSIRPHLNALNARFVN